MLPEIRELAVAQGGGAVCKASEGEGKIDSAQSVSMNKTIHRALPFI
jgi:hypothetical protein